jgi:hypothetical protein
MLCKRIAECNAVFEERGNAREVIDRMGVLETTYEEAARKA